VKTEPREYHTWAPDPSASCKINTVPSPCHCRGGHWPLDEIKSHQWPSSPSCPRVTAKAGEQTLRDVVSLHTATVLLAAK